VVQNLEADRPFAIEQPAVDQFGQSVARGHYIVVDGRSVKGADARQAPVRRNFDAGGFRLRVDVQNATARPQPAMDSL
jgi:hypothetical protein